MVMYWFINYLEFFLTSLRRCCAVVGRTFDGRRWETGYCGLKEAEEGIEKKEPGRRKTVRRADLRRKARQMGLDHLCDDADKVFNIATIIDNGVSI